MTSARTAPPRPSLTRQGMTDHHCAQLSGSRALVLGTRVLRIGGWFVVSWLFVAPASALDPAKAITQYRHTAWTGETGLPSGSVSAMAQTRDGYMWLGTEEGLVRFDGIHFRTYTVSNSPRLPHNRVVSVHAMRDGALLIGTMGGIALLKDGVFTAATHDPLRPLIAPIETRDGRILLVGVRGLEQLRDGRVEAAGMPDLGSARVRTIGEGPDGAIWVGADLGLFRWQDGVVTRFSTADGLVHDDVQSLLFARDGAFWIGTARGISVRRDGRFHTALHMPADADDPVAQLLEDRDGSIWAGASSSGLVRFTSAKIERYRAIDGLLTDAVQSLLEDREGSIWIGTFGGGVQKLSDVTFTSYGAAEGLGASPIGRAILRTRDSAIWVGLQNGTLRRLLHGRTTAFEIRDGLPGAPVVALAEGLDSALWIGTDGGGLLRFSEGRFHRFTTADGLAGNRIRVLLQRRDGALLIGAVGQGFNIFEAGHLRTVTLPPSMRNVRALIETRDNALWLASGQGVHRFTRNGRESFGAPQGVAHPVLTLYEDTAGEVWAGTLGGGLLRYD